MIIGDFIAGDLADGFDTATPGRVGININRGEGGTPVRGTIISQNVIRDEDVDMPVTLPPKCTCISTTYSMAQESLMCPLLGRSVDEVLRAVGDFKVRRNGEKGRVWFGSHEIRKFKRLLTHSRIASLAVYDGLQVR